ncbi:unnamed protein product [Didymodactylos carnosus]|uniref:Uncharacterized protein n=1 Tax=Didymodactylos carnosus TaxID=1234261 RepID=A0A815E6T7_9BILA|nr:unnamed protein product [Didymodactylos carnosus]CAF4130146.1 unnamed protein product [Didymodactylos carnosus]
MSSSACQSGSSTGQSTEKQASSIGESSDANKPSERKAPANHSGGVPLPKHGSSSGQGGSSSESGSSAS